MKKYNLIVVGGGLAGAAAAVCAAHENMSVLLIEREGCLGGAMSNNLVYPFMRNQTKINGKETYLSEGIFAEMKKRHDEKYIEMFGEDAQVPEYCLFSPECFKFILDDMVTEAGVDILLHTTVIEVKTEKDTVKSIKAASRPGIFEFEADFFIDATGDGDLFTLAGCDFQLGREKDSLCQPMTTCFRMSGVDIPKFLDDYSMLQEKYAQLQRTGDIKNPREDILTFLGIGEGIVHFNTTRIVKHNPTDPFDVSRAEIKARKQICEMTAFLKKHSEAFKNSTVISVAGHIGVRESRKLKGVHILTAEELKSCTKFDDSIALGNYDIDIHNPEGSGTSHYYFKEGEYYTIPYRSLLPKEYVNLLVAGRCISATHEAQASVRIMPICACLGQAAGTAAALAFNTKTTAHDVDIRFLQKKLKERGAQL